MTTAGLLLGLAGAAGGVWLLRTAWVRRGGGLRLLAGWALLAAAAGGWRLTGAGWDKAVALALLAPALFVLAILAATAEWPRRGGRPVRRREAQEVEPAANGGSAWRAWARVACIGPLGLAAALGCGALVALRAPWGEADRLVAAGFLTPAVWAAAGVWAMTDDRLGRVALTLVLVAVAGLGGARP